jgi:predicted DNA-binding transcriptional regulator AlpA
MAPIDSNQAVEEVKSPVLMPLLVGAPAVAKLLSVSVSQVWSMHASGTLGVLPIRLGGRTLWRRAELEAWTEAGCPNRDRWLDMRKVKKNLR